VKYLVIRRASWHAYPLALQSDLVVQGKRTVLSVEPCLWISVTSIVAHASFSPVASLNLQSRTSILAQSLHLRPRQSFHDAGIGGGLGSGACKGEGDAQGPARGGGWVRGLQRGEVSGPRGVPEGLPYRFMQRIA
jgi:hypothetical protein